MENFQDQDPARLRETSSTFEPTIIATSEIVGNLQDLEKGTNFETTNEDVEMLASHN